MLEFLHQLVPLKEDAMATQENFSKLLAKIEL
jgi:hypothetical protein